MNMERGTVVIRANNTCCWANQVLQYTEILLSSDLDNLYLTIVPQENQQNNIWKRWRQNNEV